MNRPQSPLPYLYPATPTPEPEGGATVVFRDLPEAITCGTNAEEVKAMAGEVLELAVAERSAGAKAVRGRPTSNRGVSPRLLKYSAPMRLPPIMGRVSIALSALNWRLPWWKAKPASTLRPHRSGR